MLISRFRVCCVALVVVLISLIVFAATLLNTPKKVKPLYVIRSELTYVNEGIHPWNMSEEDLTFYLFMNDTSQRVCLSGSSHPTSYGVDEDGNPYAVLEVDDLEVEPGERFTCYVEFNVFKGSRPKVSLEGVPGNLSAIPPDLREVYCAGGAVWQTEDAELRKLAEAEARGSNVLEVVLSYVRWIRSNIDYSFVEEVPMYPNETYRLRRGDCDDQAILLITLCRIYGVPAYLQVGCIYEPTQQGRKISLWGGRLVYESERVAWHGWAMVYIPPWGWVPVDLTYMRGEPITALTDAAVNFDCTVIYMNVSKQDYVGDSRKLKEYLEKNRLKVIMCDSMEMPEDGAVSNMLIQEKFKASSEVAIPCTSTNFNKYRRTHEIWGPVAQLG